MQFRRARLAAFFFLLTLLSANYFLWFYRIAVGRSAQEFYRQHEVLGKLQFLSQFVRVYDTPYYFNVRHEVQLTDLNGQTTTELLRLDSFSNPLDAVTFSHIWYWLDAGNPKVNARKGRLLRIFFCRPGVKQVNWTMHYLDDPLAVNLGQFDC